MPQFTLRVKVVGMQPDSDQFTGEQYTMIILAIQSLIPSPPAQATFPPMPKQMAWKHLLHIFIPHDKWNDQYRMWQDYDMIVKDTGEIELKLAKEE
jgi:hypothetical protein